MDLERHSLELCLARYLSLHFFFFPKGLQDWLPALALLLLAALLWCKQRSWVDMRKHRLESVLYTDVAHSIMSAWRWWSCLPFLELWGRYQSSEISRAALHSALPPIRILLVDDLYDVTGLKLEASFFAWDEVILGRVIVKLGPCIHLKINRTFFREKLQLDINNKLPIPNLGQLCVIYVSTLLSLSLSSLKQYYWSHLPTGSTGFGFSKC